MEVNQELVGKLARLSRLYFTEEEGAAIEQDLRRMIGFVEKLKEAKLEGVEPLLHLSGEVNVLRDDEITGSVSREEALRNAPQHDGTHFLVPKVIKNPNA